MKITAPKPLKALNPRTPDTKYTGAEPEWSVQPTDDDRVSRLGAAFHWYGYHYGKKEVKEFIIDWLARNDRQPEAREFARVPESTIANVYGWLARMNLMGLALTDQERQRLNDQIALHVSSIQAVRSVVEVTTEEPAAPRVTIQDRLREKLSEAAGELEVMYDELIADQARLTADYKPMAVIRGMNVAPQMVGEIAQAWRLRVDELTEAAGGRDAQLAEGYKQFTKAQLKNLIKFCELVISDCGSYVQIKKTERAPRKKKPVSPERLTQRFRCLAEFDELKLKSEPVTKLVGAQEAWFYDTKKRRLIHVTADSHVGTFTVKGMALIGFDTVNSTQKTLRKPAEQLKALMTGGLPQMRKYYRDIRATETKFNGRSNENLILLKVR